MSDLITAIKKTDDAIYSVYDRISDMMTDAGIHADEKTEPCAMMVRKLNNAAWMVLCGARPMVSVRDILSYRIIHEISDILSTYESVRAVCESIPTDTRLSERVDALAECAIVMHSMTPDETY